MTKKKKSKRRKNRRAKRTPASQAVKPKAEAEALNKSRQQRGAGRPKTGDRAVEKPRSKILWLIVPAGAALIVVLALLFLRPGRTAAPLQPVLRESGLNVLLITLDTTRADRVGCYGYAGARTPNLDSLAEGGVRFSDTYCPVPLTLPSHCSMMTGTYPMDHGVHNNGTYSLSEEQSTLAEILKAEGWQTAAFVASFSVDSRFGLDQGFDVYDDNFMEGSPFKALNAERKAEPVFQAFSRWLDTVEGERFFGWVHFFDPHLPYDPPSPFKEQFSANPYDGEIAYMDSYVGEVVRRLEEENVLDRTLIVVAGDHGEGLGDKSEAGHGIFLYDPMVKVPLILSARGHLPEGRVVNGRVRLVDIQPTILDLLSLEVRENVRGRSLIPLMEGREEAEPDVYIETFYPRENFGWSELTGLLSGPWKFIQAPKPELYNLEEDPEETVNLYADRPRIAADLGGRLDSFIKSAVGGDPGRRELSAEEQERLRSLGYIRYTDGEGTGEAADPKDKIGELLKIQTAEMYEYAGDFSAAAEIHKEMLDLRPHSASSYVKLALAQARMKDFDAAIATLKDGVKAVPDSEILLSRLGHTYFVTGRLKEAFATMQEVLAVNPRYMDALTACAIITDGQGKKEEARGYFERALAVEPENKFLRTSYALNLATSGKTTEAIAAYSSLIEDYPGDALYYQHLGITYGMAGNYEDAISNLREAVRLGPTPIAYLNLAVALKGTGDIAGAVSYLELYLQNPEGEDEAKVRSVRAELESLKRRLNR